MESRWQERKIEEALLREIAEEYLVPFFSGSSIVGAAEASSSRDKIVSLRDPTSIYFKANAKDDYRLILTRSQSFAESSEAVLPEIEVVRAFADIVGRMSEALAGELKYDLLSTFQRRVVARAVRRGEHESMLLTAIDQMVRWGSRLYEGAPISASIGFRQLKKADAVRLPAFLDLVRQDFAAVIGNGYDTMLEFDYDGGFIGGRVLSPVAAKPSSFAPLRQSGVAEWTTKSEARVALTLNRLGEIFVFRDDQLMFARRAGHWSFLTHSPVLKQMGIPKEPAIRQAIYETCLDASFARSGACIGVIGHGSTGDWEKLVSASDRLEKPQSIKAQAISKIIGTKTFPELDRRTRLELTAIDGATIIDHTGVVRAVGAILSVPAGSLGGGRLAAALEFSKFGLGVKVSQDGGITGYRQQVREPKFRVM